MSDDPADPEATSRTVDDLADPPADAGEGWHAREREVVWENPYFEAGYDVVERPGGDTARYYWIEPYDVVSVVARTGDEVVLLEQYSPRVGGSVLTCPGGGVDGGESFVEAGVRELREETGFRADEATLVEVLRPTAWVRMDQAVVVASDLEPGPTDREAGEDLTVHTVDADAAIAAVRARSPAFGGGLAPLLVAREDGLL